MHKGVVKLHDTGSQIWQWIPGKKTPSPLQTYNTYIYIFFKYWWETRGIKTFICCMYKNKMEPYLEK